MQSLSCSCSTFVLFLVPSNARYDSDRPNHGLLNVVLGFRSIAFHFSFQSFLLHMGSPSKLACLASPNSKLKLC